MNCPSKLCVVCSLLLVFGCSSKVSVNEVIGQRNRTNIQKVANTYALYAAHNQNSGPASEMELLEFVATNSHIERNLNLMNVGRDEFENCLSSLVDERRFDVRWGVAILPEGAAVPLVFEQAGVEGVRRVALSDGRVLNIEDNEKYQDLLSGKIRREDAGAAAWEGNVGETPN